METLSLDPYIVIYHDIISNAEILHLKQFARSTIKRSTVYSSRRKDVIISSGRTSHSASIPSNASKVTFQLNRRIADITGLNLKDSNPFEMINYGIGGQFSPHVDFFPPTVNHEMDNRVATLIFYLNDVEEGGATLFPELKISVFPQKGAALMWFNLDHTGKGDPRTLHCGCPVLVGSKWVLVKWISEKNQFRNET